MCKVVSKKGEQVNKEICRKSINSEYSYIIDESNNIILLEESSCHFNSIIDKKLLTLVKNIYDIEKDKSIINYTLGRLNSDGEYDIIDDLVPMINNMGPTLMYLHYTALEGPMTPRDAINKIIKVTKH